MNPAEEIPGKLACPESRRGKADEIGRQRWIDYSQDDFNASQATPEWHSWLHGIRKDPPTEDPIVQASRPPWLTVSSISNFHRRICLCNTLAIPLLHLYPVV
jgi:NADH:ubiquinone oxidoreductase subunit